MSMPQWKKGVVRPSMKPKKRGRHAKKDWQKLRLWRIGPNGPKGISEYLIDPDKQVIDIDIMTGWPSEEPELNVQMNYPAKRPE